MAVQVVTDGEFEQLVSSSPVVMVKYFADWCGSCKLFAPKYRRLSDDPRFEGIVFLDVNAEHNPIARGLANVDNLPFFATFRNGALVEGTATAKEETVVAMLERAQGEAQA